MKLLLIFSRGFYPKGGGEVSLTINPIKSLEPVILLERGNVLRVTGCAYVAGVLPFKVGSLEILFDCHFSLKRIIHL